MKRKWAVPALLLAALAGGAVVVVPRFGATPPPVDAEFDVDVARLLAEFEVPGAGIALVRNFQVSWSQGYGVAERGTTRAVTPSTLFQAASISKTVAAAGALRLVDAGVLALDRDVNRTLRDWRLKNSAGVEERAATLRLLLSHRAGVTIHGFPGYARDRAVPTLIQVLDGDPLANTGPVLVDVPPGTGMRYSGGGYCVVQQMMIDAAGKPFPELMRAQVLGPLGMESSTFEQPLPDSLRERAASGHDETGAPIPGRWHVYPEMAAAGLWTTPADLARFGAAVLAAVRGVDGAFLRRETAEQMVAPQADGPTALGWFVEGSGPALRRHHGGANAGFRCLLVICPATGDGAAVMTNSDRGDDFIQAVVKRLEERYGWPR